MTAPRFDALSAHFQDKIYASFKGQLRLAILERDFLKFDLLKRPFKTLDIGAGQGQFARVLAENGHDMTLLEAADNMLSLAKTRFAEHQLTATFIHDELQNIPERFTEPYDLILAHAVIEWLDNPADIIQIVKDLMHQHSTLSLLFYNVNGLIYHNLIRGNYRYVEKNNFRGEAGGLTPISPVQPTELKQALEAAGFEIIHQSGIRTYYDFMTKDNKQKISTEDHLKMEMHCSTKPEYLPNARYLHWLVRLK